jgi:type II secretory pathway pseudopilin PulG
MRTFFATIRSDQRLRLRWPYFVTARGRRVAVCIRNRLAERVKPSAQEGFLLVEVIVSALLVALIVVATFNGFDVVNRAQADNRAHDQAVILAAQSQEQLRTDPITTLQALENSPHTYTQTINGTTYEIKQEAAPSNGSANTTGCSAIETTRQNGANVLITSSVTWPRLGASKRPEVQLSSIITPPTGSGLEIDVGNAPAPTAGVGGVTVSVTFTPVNSASPQTLEGTTSSAGCVVFGDIEATAATVEIHEKSGFVTPSGTLKVPPKEVKLAPNITVHDAVTYNQGGAIKANFTWEGKSVSGDTFVAYNTSMNVAPSFQVGSTLFGPYEATGEEHYQAETGKYASSATTAKGVRYSTGDLFPFLEPNKWLVYSGDCTENNPHKINAAIADGEVLVIAGGTTEVNVPISKTSLLAREGTLKSPSSPVSGLEVKLTNTACAASSIPNNASKLNYWRFQKTNEGALEFPYQPFGAYELCVATGAPKNKRYKYSASNTTEAGTSPAIYLGAKSATEKAKQKTEKETEEKTTKTNRETEEATAKSKREGEEATAKAKRVSEEKPTKEAWEKEVAKNAETKTKEEAKKAERLASEKKEIELWKWEEECKTTKTKSICEKAGKVEITNAERKAKEKTQETNRNTKIAEEETANKNREKAEETAKTNRTNQENTQKAKEKTESETKTANETAENTLKTKRLGEEATTKTNREKAETEEAEEATTTKVTVESGVTTC